MPPPAAPLRVLTPEQERTIRDAIARGASDAEAGRAAGVSARKFYAAREAELSDLPRHKRGPRPGKVYAEFLDLPIDEIYRRAFEIRSQRPPGWVADDELLPELFRHRGPVGETRAAMPTAAR